MAANTDVSQAQGAQIPLQAFNIPDFPPTARGLKALTFTSEIKSEDYQNQLKLPFTVPSSLPNGTESLTLELFSLGYPTGFLTRLADRLPNLKSVVVYSQLFSGLTKESQDDSVQFFKQLPHLRALHLLDVFAKPGLFKSAAPWLKYNTSEVSGEARRGLMFLEVNYTFDQADQDYMSKIAAAELPSLIGPGLISCSFNIAPPEPVAELQPSPETDDQGVMTFNKTLSQQLVRALTDEDSYPRGLKALNTTLYTVEMEDLEKILTRHKNVMVLNVTVEIDPGSATKQKLLQAISLCEHVEQIEIVSLPTLQFLMAITQAASATMADTFPTLADMEALSGKLTKLKSFKVNILRSKRFAGVTFTKDGGRWTSRA